MKNTQINKIHRNQTLRFSIVVIVSCLISSACNTSTNKPADALDAQTQTKIKAAGTNISADVKFLDEAAEIYQEEIKLGVLAQKKSKNSEVKALGRMMETAHTNSLDALKNLAARKNITLPAEASYQLNAAYHELNEMQADTFDKAYCFKMEAAHNSAIEIFQRASRECVDTDIKKMAAGMLTDFDTHLYHVVSCLNKLEAKENKAIAPLSLFMMKN